MSSRLIELDNQRLTIWEQHELEDDPGAVVWDAALVLAHFLHQDASRVGGFSSQPLRGVRAIEIGAGLGVVGLTAALLGAHVVLTDLPAVLPGLRRNVEGNNSTDRTEVLPLRWGESVTHLSPPFDLVLASDVAYDAACVPALISTFAALCGPATRGLLAFEARPPVTDMAVALLPQHRLVGTPVPHTQMHPHWQSPDIHVLEIRTA